jgi:hypothetical protein
MTVIPAKAGISLLLPARQWGVDAAKEVRFQLALE